MASNFIALLLLHYYHLVKNKIEATKIFADGANLDEIHELSLDVNIKGFTTNPTLMRSAGVSDYLNFSRDAISLIGDRPISLEVFADEEEEMIRQGEILSKLGSNVFVKIPITNTKSVSTGNVVRALSNKGIQVNVTAVFTIQQVEDILKCVNTQTAFYISVFAGRIADAGIDPMVTVRETVDRLKPFEKGEVIWASPREIYNYVQAQETGCQIITMTRDLIKKIPNLGKNLNQFSLETVQMFARDAETAGYKL